MNEYLRMYALVCVCVCVVSVYRCFLQFVSLANVLDHGFAKVKSVFLRSPFVLLRLQYFMLISLSLSLPPPPLPLACHDV